MFRRVACSTCGTSVIERSRTIALHKNWLVLPRTPSWHHGGFAFAEDAVDPAALNPRTAVSGQGGQSDVQDRIRWDGRLYTYPDTAAITPNAMSATAPTVWAPSMHQR